MSDDLVKRAREVLNGVTPGPWIGCNMIHADRGDEMTPEEIGEYVKNSVKMGDKSQFLFISGKHDDGEDCDICHTGNGPRGDKNTRFIAASRELVPAMADRIEELEATIAALEAVWAEVYRRGQEDMRELAAEVLRDKWASTTAEHEEAIRAIPIKEKDDE